MYHYDKELIAELLHTLHPSEGAVGASGTTCDYIREKYNISDTVTIACSSCPLYIKEKCTISHADLDFQKFIAKNYPELVI